MVYSEEIERYVYEIGRVFQGGRKVTSSDLVGYLLCVTEDSFIRREKASKVAEVMDVWLHFNVDGSASMAKIGTGVKNAIRIEEAEWRAAYRHASRELKGTKS